MSGQMTFNVKSGDLYEDMNVFHLTGETAICWQKSNTFPFLLINNSLNFFFTTISSFLRIFLSENPINVKIMKFVLSL